jgi:peptidoglycan/xylan/chitin deacetylase (PgdA/CDA1 family)/glycosyltransferase involved in cell wall biosynthesis
MRISVIVATWNRCELLKRTLPTLLRQEFPRDEYEIIMVVGGSTDETAEWLRSQTTDRNLRIVEQPDSGQAAAINAALQVAQGELVLFLDDDILCSPNLVAEHASAPRTDNSCLAYGPVLIAPENDDHLAADNARRHCDDFFATITRDKSTEGWYGHMASANSSAPRELLLSLGGLDERFNRSSDRELGFRLRKAGYDFVYCPAAISHQIYLKGRSDILADAEADGASDVHLCRKHPEMRASTRVGTLWSEPWWKRAAFRVAGQLRFSLAPAISPFIRALSRLHRVPPFRHAALRLFGVQQSVAAFRGAVKAAALPWQQLRDEFREFELPVLMYHHIGPKVPGTFPEITVSPAHFRRHLRWLKRRGYSTITSAQWLAYCQSGESLPKKAVLLTFDDAYEDLAEHCFPALESFGYTGIVFVPTANIAGTNIWDQLDGSAPHRLLSSNQIRRWADRGIEFGAHTRVHPDLRRLSDEELDEELELSRLELEAVIDRPVVSFAYPFGYYGDREVEAARRHFSLSYTVDEGRNRRTTDLARLRRTTMYPGRTLMFLTCFLVGFDPIRRLREKVQIRSRLRRFWRHVTSPA